MPDTFIGHALLLEHYLLLVHDPINYPLTLIIVDIRNLRIAEGVGTSIEDLDAVCRLRYPEKLGSFACHRTFVHLAPSSHGSQSLKTPFCLSQDRLIMIRISYSDLGLLSLKSLVLLSTILDCIKRVNCGRRRDFDWDEWGPRGCRLIHPDTSFHPYTYGTHVIPYPKSPLISPPLYLCDFGQLSARKHLADKKMGRNTPGNITPFPDEMYGPSRVFACQDITTSLPARIIKGQLDAEDQAVQLIPGEDCIIMFHRVSLKYL